MSMGMLRGNAETVFVPTVQYLSGGIVTMTEWEAGLKLGAGFNAVDGLARQQNPINTPVMKYRTELQIAGPEQFQTVTFTFVEDDGTGVDEDALDRQAIIEALVEGVEGVFIFSRYQQNPTPGAPGIFTLPGSIAAQDPNWDMGATALTTAVSITPSAPLRKAILVAGS